MVDDIPMLSEDECVALDSSLAEETVSNEEQARFDIACEDYSNRTWLKNSPLSVKFQLFKSFRPHHDKHRLLHVSKLARNLHARQFRLFKCQIPARICSSLGS